MREIMVLAVHPDDETLGCGGTLLRHKARGDRICWVILTGMDEKGGYGEEGIRRREEEIDLVTKAYGFDAVYRLGYPTMRLDRVPMADLIRSLTEIFEAVSPEVLYCPFHNDVHSDHRVAFKAAMSCAKSFRQPSVRKILMMETLSETEFATASVPDAFVPNIFADITDYFHRKIEIAEIYGSEMGEHPFPRSVKNLEALASFRGAAAGCTYAESFMLVREIIP